MTATIKPTDPISIEATVDVRLLEAAASDEAVIAAARVSTVLSARRTTSRSRPVGPDR